MRTLLIFILLSGPVFYGIPKPVHPFAKPGTIVYPTPEEFLAVHNKLRQEQHLPPIETDERLTEIAQRYAVLCRNQGRNSHYWIPLETRLLNAGYDYRVAKENLAGGPEMLYRDPFALWKDSPPHYTNILSPRMHALWLRRGLRQEGLWLLGGNHGRRISSGN
jgi:hypothetical protein